MKKAISLVLVLMMLLFALPLTSYAASADLSDSGAFAVSSVTVTDVVAPVPGASPSYTASVPDNAGYQVEDYDDDHNWYLNGVAWINVTDNKNINYRKDKFVEGKQYKVCVSLVTVGRNFLFSDDLTGTINGHKAEITWSAGNTPNPILQYTFTCETPKTYIDAVAVTGTPKAYVGQNAAEHPPVGLMSSEAYSITETGWRFYNKHTQAYDEFDGAFTQGTYYPCYTLTAGESYCFSDSVSVTFADGSNKTVQPVDGELFVIGSGVKAIAFIDSVAVIDATAPVAGETPSFSVSLPKDAAGYQIRDFNTDGFQHGVAWVDVAADRRLKSNEPFVVGREYMLWIALEPASDAYEFSDSTAATLNGKKAVTDLHNIRDLSVKYTFSCEKPQLLGDVDTDGSVTIFDATFIQRKLAGMQVVPFDVIAADTDEDTFITILDATFIQRWLAGMTSNPNIGKPITKASL